MKKRGLSRTVVPLLAVMLGMGAMAWAAVPLYSLFCRVTGYAGTTQVADSGADQVLEREMTIRFVGSTASGMPWQFAPEQTTKTVHIGETTLAYFTATNPTDQTITGTATFNVTPLRVGGYFVKIDCFCFTEQTLEPGETVLMPVTFFVDPAIVDDRETRGIDTITLSYTFFEKSAKHAEVNVTRATRGG